MQKILAFFREEVRFLITIATIVVSITWAFATMNAKLDQNTVRLDRIENNHLVHIYSLLQEVSTRLTRVETIQGMEPLK